MKRFVLLLCLAFSLNAIAQTAPFKIGVHYFPGWKDNQLGAAYPIPWDKIKPYPEREPLLGWYTDGEASVMNQHLEWMGKYGINFVVFNWFWSAESKPILSHALNAYLQAPSKHGVEFAIMWANHTKYIFSKKQFETMFRFWAQRYMFRSDYLKVDGKPVVFILSADILNKNAVQIGMQPAQLTALADQIFKEAGLPGINFIAGAGARQGGGLDYTRTGGYTGYFAYNYYGPATYRFANGRYLSHSYEEMTESYRDQWKWFLNNDTGTYFLPMTSGWDKRPWGGSKVPEQDNSASTPAAFEKHLLEAKAKMRAYPEKTKGLGLICCWNEFGEGSYIEPTKKYQFQYLESVKKVFGSP